MRDSSGKCYSRACADGTYLDTKRAQCSICEDLCKLCDGEGSCIECDSKVPTSIVNDTTICSLCPDGYDYDHKWNKCKGNS